MVYALSELNIFTRIGDEDVGHISYPSAELLIKNQLSHVLYLLLANSLNQLRFSDSNMVENILQIHRFPCPHERLDIGAEILMQLLFGIPMNGRAISYSGIVSDLSYSHVEIL